MITEANAVLTWVEGLVGAAPGITTIVVEESDDTFAFVDESVQEVYIVTVKRAKFVPVEDE